MFANQTPFFPKRTLSINVAYNRLDRYLLGPWLLFNSGKKIVVTNCADKEVVFTQDGEFAGAVQELFWGGFFEPEFKRVIHEQIDQTVEDCQPYPELAQAALNETAGLLRQFSRKVYGRLAEIDQRIRGKGDPNAVPRRAVDDKVKALNGDIDVLVKAAGKRLSPRSRWNWLVALRQMLV